MKKNTILYILLIFLIVVNAFFLFNYMGKSNAENPKKSQRDRDFIVKELGFNEEQIAQFKENSKGHHEEIMSFSNDIKNLKDQLFNELSNDSIKKEILDSITSLIGEKEEKKQQEIFSHFKMIQELSNDKQKEKFKTIIMHALRGGERGNRPPPNRRDGRRPPPPEEGNGHRPPPRDN